MEGKVPYLASAWFRAENAGWTSAVQELRLDFYDINKSTLLAPYRTTLASVSTAWEQHSVTGMAPAKTTPSAGRCRPARPLEFTQEIGPLLSG